MNVFPTPPPDRRIDRERLNKTSSMKTQLESGTKLPYLHSSSNQDNILEFEKINNINMVKIKHIEDMRNNIFNYKVNFDSNDTIGSSR